MKTAQKEVSPRSKSAAIGVRAASDNTPIITASSADDFGLPEVDHHMYIDSANVKRAIQLRPAKGPAGLSWGSRSVFLDGHTLRRINEVLFRDKAGNLVGLLQLFPDGGTVSEPGQYEVVVYSHYRRRGVGLQLLAVADELWSLDFWIQKYSPEGRALVVRYLTLQARGELVGANF